jgi:uncharacterized protein YraI
LILIGFSSLLIIGTFWAAAQEGVEVSDAVCSPALFESWTVASDMCTGGPVGYVCNGGGAPQAEPTGPVSNSLSLPGAKVDITVVEALRTPPLSVESGRTGLAWLRVAEPAFNGLLVGDVSLRNVTPPDFPAWQSIMIETGPTALACGAAPVNGFIVQTPLDPETRIPLTTGIVINGSSLVFNGTVLIQTKPDATMFINLSGQARVLARGQEQLLRTGQQLNVPYTPGNFSVPAGIPTFPQPLETGLIANYPVGLLDLPLQLPQSGYVETAAPVNLRTEPTTDGGLIFQVPAGIAMSVLGRNPTGDWYHVRLDNGITGWMFAELLQQNVGNIQTAYEATPAPPQRYGAAGTTAHVITADGLNLRDAPDVQFGVVGTVPLGTELTLLARSPYGPWVKVEGNGMVGWAALIVLDTDAVIEALPIDFNVPPPPAPTRVPGSFGNAFPDPRGG